MCQQKNKGARRRRGHRILPQNPSPKKDEMVLCPFHRTHREICTRNRPISETKFLDDFWGPHFSPGPFVLLLNVLTVLVFWSRVTTQVLLVPRLPFVSEPQIVPLLAFCFMGPWPLGISLALLTTAPCNPRKNGTRHMFCNNKQDSKWTCQVKDTNWGGSDMPLNSRALFLLLTGSEASARLALFI